MCIIPALSPAQRSGLYGYGIIAFESSHRGNKDRFLAGDIPVRLEYKATRRVDELVDITRARPPSVQAGVLPPAEKPPQRCRPNRVFPETASEFALLKEKQKPAKTPAEMHRQRIDIVSVDRAEIRNALDYIKMNVGCTDGRPAKPAVVFKGLFVMLRQSHREKRLVREHVCTEKGYAKITLVSHALSGRFKDGVCFLALVKKKHAAVELGNP
jgi:hypothetical protein